MAGSSGSFILRHRFSALPRFTEFGARAFGRVSSTRPILGVASTDMKYDYSNPKKVQCHEKK